MRVTTALQAGAAALAIGAAVRQRVDARRTATGAVATLGADGTLDDAPDGGLHAAVAGWRPARPTTLTGRVVAALWALPTTLAGLVVALAGGTLPRPVPGRGCLLAAPVVGLPAAGLRAAGAQAATIGAVVLSRTAPVSQRLLDHELAHVRQQERLGPLFPLAYGLAQVRWGYRANPFEVAARGVAAEAVTRRSAT